MQGNQEFADVLVEELQRVAILISILTPSYVGSEWCQREIDEFVRIAEKQGGLKIGKHQKRIFRVEKTPVPREEYPPALQGQTGYPFYVEDKQKGRKVELSLSPDEPRRNALAKETIDDLAYHIVETLKVIRKMPEFGAATNTNTGAEPTDSFEAEATQDAAAPAGKDRLPIYLAETNFDLSEERTKVRRELEAQGYHVLPEGDLPIRQPDEFRHAVIEALDQCKLSIHMIGAGRPPTPAGETDDVVVLQNQLAAEQCGGSKLERLIWLPEGLSSDDENQQEFIEKLQRDPETQGNADVLQVPLQELITNIHDSLNKLEAEQKQQESADRTAPATGRKQIYVSYARDDKQAAAPLIEHLFDTGFDVLEPLLDDNAEDKQVVAVHKGNLTDCDAALIFTDQGGEYWLKMQMGELRKAPHWRGNRPMLARAIYLGPGMSNATVRTHDLLLKGSEKFVPETLAPFLTMLGESGGVQS